MSNRTTVLLFGVLASLIIPPPTDLLGNPWTKASFYFLFFQQLFPSSACKTKVSFLICLQRTKTSCLVLAWCSGMDVEI